MDLFKQINAYLIFGLSTTMFLVAGCQSVDVPITHNQPNKQKENKLKSAAKAPGVITNKIRKDLLPKISAEKGENIAGTFTNPSNNVSVKSNKFMITAANPLAAEAGASILRKGGSAVDAAIATQLALNVVEPQSSGIGGGGFLLHYQASSRIIEAYDGREKAPAAATSDMFLESDGTRRNFYDAVPGGLSVGVPGTLRMLELAHNEHGKLPWSKLFEPAIKLADQGFDISPRLNSLVKIDRHLKKFKVSRNYFYNSAGFAKRIGTRLQNKVLAKTLRQIADRGSDYFYKGNLAKKIVKTIRNSKINPGRIQLSDMEMYNAKKRDPVCSFYRKWLICGMPPPTSGGITTLQILGLLQGIDLSKLIPGSTETIHIITEAERLAFADRNKFIADEDFVPVPTSQLLDPGYLKERLKLISMSKSMGKARPGKIKYKTVTNHGYHESMEGDSTSHISIVDKNGNAVSMTSSIENAFGSRLMVGGFLLNNQLTDFSFLPKVNGRSIANRVEPNKRPRSSMSPMLVVDSNAKLVMAIGSPGGSRIIGYVAKTLIAALDWKMGIQAAINLPHFVNRNGVTDIEQGSHLEMLKPKLEKLGHKVQVRKLTSGLHGILVGNDSRLYGGADPRREGIAIGN